MVRAGSSTACIVCLNGAQLHAANLGDSGFMVLRDGKLIFESPSQQHSFNFPFQVGSHGDPVGSSQVRPARSAARARFTAALRMYVSACCVARHDERHRG